MGNWFPEKTKKKLLTTTQLYNLIDIHTQLQVPLNMYPINSS